jgi:hypothetical protein
MTIPPKYLAVTRINFADEDQQRIQTDDTGNAMILEASKIRHYRNVQWVSAHMCSSKFRNWGVQDAK